MFKELVCQRIELNYPQGTNSLCY